MHLNYTKNINSYKDNTNLTHSYSCLSFNHFTQKKKPGYCFSFFTGDRIIHTDTLCFMDANADKSEILKVSKNKTGVYLWRNKLNNKKYVGSSTNLRRRFAEYFNINRLLREPSMPINVALLKHGFSNFSLDILEFCEVNKLMEREKYYFGKLSPEYNILKVPGSPDRGKGWKHSEASLEKMRLAALNKPAEMLAQLSLAQPNGKKLEVTNTNTGTKTAYHAIRAAAKDLGIDKRYIENYIYLKQKKPVFGTYIFKLAELCNKESIHVKGYRYS